MALAHNSKIADKEPSWGSIDKTKLPRNAHADMGNLDEKSSWRYPHHFVKNGKVGGKNGVYISGDMFLHKGGLRAALQAIGGARSGKEESSSSVKAHLARHSKAIGMSDKETASLLSISIIELHSLLEQNIKTSKGGDSNMDLEAKIKELEEQLKAKTDEITALQSDKAIAEFQDKIENLESEKADLETKVEGLETEIAEMKKAKEDLKVLADIGKKAMDSLVEDIKKMSIALEGDKLNEDMLDKELNAFANDFEYLSNKKAKLEVQMGETFKTGDFQPDETKTKTDKAAEERDLGRKIGEANRPKLAVVSHNKQ